MPSRTTLIVGAAAIAAVTAYRTIVPSDHGSLPNLSSLTEKDDDPYPEDFWPSSLYAPSSKGKTHYFLLGPSTGPKLICIHGITAGWTAMPNFINTLAAAGFHVLVFDLYGRGYSDAPGGEYNEDLYVGQVKELLDHVGWEKSLVLGYSLGGAIATAFSARHAERVVKLCLVAPAGLMKELPTGGKILTFPVIGKFIAHLVGRQILVRLSASKHNPALLQTAELQQFIKVTNLVALKHPGFMRAYLSTIHKGPVMNLDHRYEQIGQLIGDRVFCIWGNADDTVNFTKDAPIFKKYNPTATFVELDGVGHSLLVEKPDECSKLIVEFFMK
ncbi:Alpha/Beta hydrolase protein [Chytridium lagenaria]|nr:Alpha/Beta hydrolase protein [Chytridium lagenaria]